MKNDLRGILLLLFAAGLILAGRAAPLHAAGFAPVVPGRPFHFPRDHGAHPAFKTEWWYFTGHLQDEAGNSYGFQWTVFRSGLRPPGAESLPSRSPWRAEQIYLGHAALSDLQEKSFAFEESAARGVLGLAEASEEGFALRLPGFSAKTEAGETLLGAQRGELRMELKFRLPESVLLHGERGYAPKSREPGKASYYYSIPEIPVTGTLWKAGREIPIQGRAWMDHEFGSGQLGPEQSGWDWMGIPLGEGEALMVYRLRDRREESGAFLLGTYRDVQGQVHRLEGGDLILEPSGTWRSPRSGGRYPLRWRIRAPKWGIDLEVSADFPEQELDTRKSTQVIYWEGSVRARGKVQGREVKSQGYLEMTGYARDFEQKL